jgi:hypothetical protein
MFYQPGKEDHGLPYDPFKVRKLSCSRTYTLLESLKLPSRRVFLSEFEFSSDNDRYKSLEDFAVLFLPKHVSIPH